MFSKNLRWQNVKTEITHSTAWSEPWSTSRPGTGHTKRPDGARGTRWRWTRRSASCTRTCWASHRRPWRPSAATVFPPVTHPCPRRPCWPAPSCRSTNRRTVSCRTVAPVRWLAACTTVSSKACARPINIEAADVKIIIPPGPRPTRYTFFERKNMV